MRLKLRRSQRDGGIISKTVVFCLDAQAQFTAAEQASIGRYKLHNQVIYNSEASRRLLDRSSGHLDGSVSGGLKSLALTAMAAMKLNITISSLQRGEHVECKSLDELLAAEDAIMTACQNLKGYLDVAATFDGREVVIDFDGSEPELMAQTISAAPMLVATPAMPRAEEIGDVRDAAAAAERECVRPGDMLDAAAPPITDAPAIDRPATARLAVLGDVGAPGDEPYGPHDHGSAGPLGSLSSGQQLALILGGLLVLYLIAGIG